MESTDMHINGLKNNRKIESEREKDSSLVVAYFPALFVICCYVVDVCMCSKPLVIFHIFQSVSHYHHSPRHFTSLQTFLLFIPQTKHVCLHDFQSFSWIASLNIAQDRNIYIHLSVSTLLLEELKIYSFSRFNSF